MQKNDEIILNITDLTDEGSGVGKYERLVVFVPSAAVGDTLRVKILKVKKTYAYGKIMEIITPAESRIEPDCPVFLKCGGCALRHINYKAESEIKQNRVYETVKRIGGVDLEPKPIISANSSCRYRNKAQYPISLDGKAGFYAFHSHRIIPQTDCLLQPQEFCGIVEAVEKWVKDNKISVYDETVHKGLLRHLYIRKATATGETMVTFVINGNVLPKSEEIVASLKEICGGGLKSIQININTQNTNVILGDKCQTLWGEDYITDILCGIKVRLSPLSFYQVNREMAEKLYNKGKEYAIPKGRDILDLYCGAGTIGLSMAKEAKSVIGVEIVPEAIEDAKFNAAANGIENARFICADAAAAAEELAKEGTSPQTVIVDPPRKGLTEELILTIAERFAPERVVYVSCDVATLARDTKLFADKGYILREYTPVDLFPRTAHVETVALLIKSK